MNATITFFDRYGIEIGTPAGKLRAVRYTKSAVGGPKTAELRADGSLGDLYELLSYLEKGVKIFINGQAAWWGFLNEVRIYDGDTETVVSLDRMYNRIAIAYELTSSGSTTSTRMTTAWLEDSMSMQLYGRKELLATSRGISTAHAEADRARLLEVHKFPPALLMASNRGAERPYAVLFCSGWWKTLGWQYASVPLLLALQYPTIGLADHSIGAGADSRLAQAFDIGPAAVNAAAVDVYIRKVGAPLDNLTVSIHENPDDLTPGASLASVNIAGTALTTSYAWTRFTFSAAAALSANRSYFVQVTRSGADDGSNHYQLRMDSLQGYPQGPCRRYNGSWNSVAEDMPFRIYADAIVSTSQQILGMLNSYAQFLARAKVETDSGFQLESYRDGDSTALAEIEHLMQIGTTGNVRYLAEVNESNHVRVYAEPLEDENPYTIDRNLNVFDGGGSPVEQWRVPAGVYMRARTSAIGVLNRLAGINLTMFVEEVEYDVERAALRITPRGAPKPEDELMRVANG